MSDEAVWSPRGGDLFRQLFLLPLVERPDGRGPDLPEGTGFLLVAESPRCPGFGIYQVPWELKSHPPAGLPVPRALERSYESAQAYPPALAFARRELDRDEGEPIAPEALVQRFGASLRRHLDAQPTDGYVLARVVRSSDIEALPGAYRWLVRHDPEHRTVVYVSDDYFTYPAPARWFAVSPEALAKLPRAEIGPHMLIEPRFVSHAEGEPPPTLRMRPSMPDDDTDFE